MQGKTIKIKKKEGEKWKTQIRIYHLASFLDIFNLVKSANDRNYNELLKVKLIGIFQSKNFLIFLAVFLVAFLADSVFSFLSFINFHLFCIKIFNVPSRFSLTCLGTWIALKGFLENLSGLSSVFFNKIKNNNLVQNSSVTERRTNKTYRKKAEGIKVQLYGQQDLLNKMPHSFRCLGSRLGTNKEE